MTLVIMAAGIGSRYGGLKQIDPVGPSREIILDYAVYDAIRVGFDRVVFVIRKEMKEDFTAAIGSRYGRKICVDYAFQELSGLPSGFSIPEGRKKPWGTGHAVLSCKGLVNEPFAVLNADDFYGPRSFDALGGFLKSVPVTEDRYAMVGFILRESLSDHGSVARGVCGLDDRGFLKVITERTKIERDGTGARFLDEDGFWKALTGDERVSMNMWGFTPAFFHHLESAFVSFLKRIKTPEKEEFFLPTVVCDLIQAGKATVQVLSTSEKWFGMTYPEDKSSTQEGINTLVEKGEYPTNLWE